MATPALDVPLPNPLLPGAPGPIVHVPGTNKGPLDPRPSGKIPNPLHALSGAEQFLADLTDPHTYIRVAEVMVGLLLIGVGINAMLHGAPTKAAGKAAKTAAVL